MADGHAVEALAGHPGSGGPAASLCLYQKAGQSDDPAYFQSARSGSLKKESGSSPVLVPGILSQSEMQM